jgi:hypothetical protein
MTDRDDEPTDLLDAISRLNDMADWLDDTYPNEAAALRTVADDLMRYIVVTATPGAAAG